MYIYGEAAVGKTYFCAHFPNTVVLDLERKAHHFADELDFYLLEPSSLDELYQAIAQLSETPGDITTVVVDGASAYKDLLEDKNLRRLRIKNGNPNYVFKPSDYKVLKNEIKTFVNNLIDLDTNVIFTARLKTKYDASGGEIMKVIGTEPDGPKEFPYMFDVVIELEGTGSGSRTAYIRRDNTRRLPDVIEDFSYKKLVSYYENSGYTIDAKAEPVKQNSRRQVGRNVTTEFNGKTVATAGILGETISQIAELVTDGKISEGDLLTKIAEDYPGAESVFDLREDEGKMLLKDIIEKTNTGEENKHEV
jgi:hypothetical protein